MASDDTGQKIKKLTDENNLLMADISAILRRINIPQASAEELKLIEKYKKKLRENNRLLEIKNLQIDILKRMLELERERNFEEELLAILKAYRERRIDEKRLLQRLEHFHQTRTLMHSSLDERNLDFLYDLYDREGEEALDKSLDEEGFYGPLRASIYSYISEKLHSTHMDAALIFARKAWEENPSPELFKNLAFRYWEAENPIFAKAYIEFLGEDYDFSSEEERSLASSIRRAKSAV